MSKFHSPDNYNGTMRVDSNANSKPVCGSSFPLFAKIASAQERTDYPNSYHSLKPAPGTTPGFGGSHYTETPYQVCLLPLFVRFNDN